MPPACGSDVGRADRPAARIHGARFDHGLHCGEGDGWLNQRPASSWMVALGGAIGPGTDGWSAGRVAVDGLQDEVGSEGMGGEHGLAAALKGGGAWPAKHQFPTARGRCGRERLVCHTESLLLRRPDLFLGTRVGVDQALATVLAMAVAMAGRACQAERGDEQHSTRPPAWPCSAAALQPPAPAPSARRACADTPVAPPPPFQTPPLLLLLLLLLPPPSCPSVHPPMPPSTPPPRCQSAPARMPPPRSRALLHVHICPLPTPSWAFTVPPVQLLELHNISPSTPEHQHALRHAHAAALAQPPRCPARPAFEARCAATIWIASHGGGPRLLATTRRLLPPNETLLRALFANRSCPPFVLLPRPPLPIVDRHANFHPAPGPGPRTRPPPPTLGQTQSEAPGRYMPPPTHLLALVPAPQPDPLVCPHRPRGPRARPPPAGADDNGINGHDLVYDHGYGHNHDLVHDGDDGRDTRGILIPIHAQTYALQCGWLPYLGAGALPSNNPAHGVPGSVFPSRVPADRLYLPVVPVHVPYPTAFAWTHEFLYLQDSAVLWARVMDGAVAWTARAAAPPAPGPRLAHLARTLPWCLDRIEAAWYNGNALRVVASEYWAVLAASRQYVTRTLQAYSDTAVAPHVPPEWLRHPPRPVPSASATALTASAALTVVVPYPPTPPAESASAAAAAAATDTGAGTASPNLTHCSADTPHPAASCFAGRAKPRVLSEPLLPATRCTKRKRSHSCSRSRSRTDY